jgi:phosphatidylserine decarboxylase
VFAREGYVIIAIACMAGALLAGGGLWLGGVLGAVGVLLGVGAVAFTLYFFRDPERTPPSGAEGLLLSPADGTVVEVVEGEEEPLYLKGEATRVSIFLSPLNVHVNRTPAAGQIEYERYVPGDYLVAWHPKASTKNERSDLGLRHDATGTKVLFKQIAGAVARRIVYHLREGDRVTAGERFGIVKFGSRMDVLVPPSAELHVEEGQRVRGGESVLGELVAAEEPPADEPPADERRDGETGLEEAARDGTSPQTTAPESAEAPAGDSTARSVS